MERSRKEGERVEFLCNKYSSDDVDVAKLICDDHPSENLAFRIFDTDMKASDLSYGDLKKQSELLSKGLISKGIKSGDRIAQLLIAKYHHVEWQKSETLDDTQRGQGGFGHSGKN